MPKDRKTLRHSVYFLGKFLRDPKGVASIVPSSRYLGEAMTRDLRFKPGDVVLEYGPGTGSLTAALEPKLGKGVHYLGIEQDPDFHRILVNRFPHLKFHLGSVEDVEQILRRYGLGRPKVIISALPFVGMQPSLMRRIIETTRTVLRRDGIFRTFTYVHAYPMPGASRLRALMAERFSQFRFSRPVLRNIPPAVVLTGRP